MNVLIFEYITGGGLVDEVLPASLVKEGELMLNAVASDFEELPDVQVSVLRDYRLQNGEFSNERIVNVENSFSVAISSVENSIDALLIIAPESDGILSTLCETYEDSDFVLLNSSVHSISLMSDKLKTYQYLQNFNIPQISSYALEEIYNFNVEGQLDLHKEIQSNIQLSPQDTRVVIKPKDGAGCENIYVLDTYDSIADVINPSKESEFIVQPYIKGQSASLCLLCWQGECSLLSANIQSIEFKDNSLVLQQCLVNALERDGFLEFSKQLIKVLPELRGYIGVDIIIAEKEIFLVEINPRLTTSYAGLRSALGVNPAKLILQTFIDQKLPQVEATSDNTIIIGIGKDRAA